MNTCIWCFQYIRGTTRECTHLALQILECWQVVQRDMRDREHWPSPTPNQGVDKSDPQYVERLRQSKLAAEAVRQGCATGEQQRAVSLKRRTEREYRDVDVYVQVNTAIDPKMFIPDL
jgi:hypothetical protein